MTTCTICYEEHSSFYSLPCDHKFCGVCLKSHFSLAATEADLSRLVCPDTECRMSLAAPNHMPMILDIAGKAAFEQIQAALNTHLLQSSDFYSCPKCGVKGFSQSDGSSLHGNSVACSKCKFEFCSTCQADMYHYNLPHGDRDCKTVMRQKEAAWLMFCADALGKILEEKGQKDAATKQLHEAFQKTQKEQKGVLAAFERDEKAKATWVHCPHCDALWSGSDACSHVTCGVLSGSEVRGVVGCDREFDLDDAKKYIPAETPSLEELVKPHDSADEISHDASLTNARQQFAEFACAACIVQDTICASPVLQSVGRAIRENAGGHRNGMCLTSSTSPPTQSPSRNSKILLMLMQTGLMSLT